MGAAMNRILTLPAHALIALAIGCCTCGTALWAVLYAYGSFHPWKRYALPPTPVDTIVVASSDQFVVTTAAAHTYAWDFSSGWKSTSAPITEIQTWAKPGQRPCQNPAAFRSLTRPALPYRDCVSGRDDHPEAVTNFLLMIDHDGVVWSWTAGSAGDAAELVQVVLSRVRSWA